MTQFFCFALWRRARVMNFVPLHVGNAVFEAFFAITLRMTHFILFFPVPKMKVNEPCFYPLIISVLHFLSVPYSTNPALASYSNC